MELYFLLAVPYTSLWKNSPWYQWKSHQEHDSQAPTLHRGAHAVLRMEGELTLLSSIPFLIPPPPPCFPNLVLSLLPLSHSPCRLLRGPSPSRPDEDAYSPQAFGTNPALWASLPEKVGGCVPASEAYFYTHVCPESDVVYHSLQRPIVQHFKKNVVILPASASARLSLDELLDEIR